MGELLNQKMTDIANEIRRISQDYRYIGLDDMSNNLKTVNEDISTESELIEQIKNTIIGKAKSERTDENYIVSGAGNVSTYTNSRVAVIGSNAFRTCSTLVSVNFPNCMIISADAFGNCTSLSTASFPECTSIGGYAFWGCSKLSMAGFPACTNIGYGAFSNCYSLTTASFPVCTNIYSYAFRNCRTLSSITLGASTVCTLANSNAFSSTPYAGYSTYFSGTPYIYVPASLVSSYQTATNWTYFSSYFSAIVADNIITFTIDGTEYQAEEGMTWGEWIDSDYNIYGYVANNGYIVNRNCTLCICDSDYVAALSTQTIISNHNYIHKFGSSD